MKRLWKNYNLTIVLLVMFAISWLLQAWTGWHEFGAEQLQHGAQPHLFGPDGYAWVFGRATFENWQSEFLQVATFVVMTSFLIHKGSAESRDGQDEMQASLARIERRLRELDGTDLKGSRSSAEKRQTRRG